MERDQSAESGLISFQIEKSGPYRFIGKSVYAGAFVSNSASKELYEFLWKQSDWVFRELDKLMEFVSDDPHNAALRTWDAYADTNAQLFGITVGATKLIGYTVGRFMKAGTPVPENMNYIDIPEVHIAKAWLREKLAINSSEVCLVSENTVTGVIQQTGEYKDAPWMFAAEVYPPPDENGVSIYGSYCACIPLTEQEKENKYGN